MRQVKQSLGPIQTSRELSLPGPWSRYMAPTCFGRPQRITSYQRPLRRRLLPSFPQKDLSLSADTAARDVQDAKRRLRMTARAARATAAAADRAAGSMAAEAVSERLLAAVDPQPGTVVSAYWPMGDEIDPRPLMEALHRRGLRLALPAIRAAGAPLDFRAWAPGDPVVPAGFGTRQPAATAPLLVPDLLLVPLLAFDDAGYRLGYGGGFYDRSLALLRAVGDILAVGLAFAAQQVPAVPREATDQPLDLVVTEAGTLRPGGRPAGTGKESNA